MDFREFGFWSGEAGRARVRREADLMEHVRLAMWAEGRDFQAIVRRMREAVMTPAERKASQDAMWTNLKVIGRA